MPGYTATSDLELSLLLKSSDAAAFSEIYRRYSARLLFHAANKLQDLEEAKDVVHEVFFCLWNKRTELRIHSNLSGYLYAATRNKILDRFAHSKVKCAYEASLQKFLEEGDCITDQAVREHELRNLIEEEIAALPAKMRKVFEFSRKDSYSHREISALLNISEETVKKQVHNALKILKIKLTAFLF